MSPPEKGLSRELFGVSAVFVTCLLVAIAYVGKIESRVNAHAVEIALLKKAEHDEKKNIDAQRATHVVTHRRERERVDGIHTAMDGRTDAIVSFVQNEYGITVKQKGDAR